MEGVSFVNVNVKVRSRRELRRRRGEENRREEKRREEKRREEKGISLFCH
jgi:hypothetical protein